MLFVLWGLFIFLITVILIKTIQIEVKIRHDRVKFDEDMKALREREKHPWDG